MPVTRIGAGADRRRLTTIPDPDGLGTRWCGDITYVSTEEGWLYPATVTWERSGWSGTASATPPGSMARTPPWPAF
ncbi:hypothetical protein [Streptomyces sp. NPDC127066]|uniref:hypothetical protein n=1 Tax=Streptomyces sp. NPDC127066 TaxID=3347125 RepID=UPI00365DFBB2